MKKLNAIPTSQPSIKQHFSKVKQWVVLLSSLICQPVTTPTLQQYQVMMQVLQILYQGHYP